MAEGLEWFLSCCCYYQLIFFTDFFKILFQNIYSGGLKGQPTTQKVGGGLALYKRLGNSQYQSIGPVKAGEQGLLITGLGEVTLSHPLVTPLSPPGTGNWDLCSPGLPVSLCRRPSQYCSSGHTYTIDSTSFQKPAISKEATVQSNLRLGFFQVLTVAPLNPWQMGTLAM